MAPGRTPQNPVPQGGPSGLSAHGPLIASLMPAGPVPTLTDEKRDQSHTASRISSDAKARPVHLHLVASGLWPVRWQRPPWVLSLWGTEVLA